MTTAWPELPPVSSWADTRDTVHLWTQIVGKVRLALEPPVNHWWQVPLYVSARGLTTSLMHGPDRGLEIEFDFLAHRLVLRTTEDTHEEVALEPRSVADFYAATTEALDRLHVPVDMLARPVEVPVAIPFADDTEHHAYDADAMHQFWLALVEAHRVLTIFRSGFVGKASPVHFFWGGVDLATTRFSGRPAPPHPGGVPNVADWVNREAYSHEVSSCGFWPGGGADCTFYSYAYPEPEGFRDWEVRPDAAAYDTDQGLFVLPYGAVRSAADPDAALLGFLEATYEAAAELAALGSRRVGAPEPLSAIARIAPLRPQPCARMEGDPSSAPGSNARVGRSPHFPFRGLFACSPFAICASRSARRRSSTGRASRWARARRSASSAATAPGKTTLLRVFGGAAPPKSGTVQRPPATGYLSQDPRTEGVPDDTNCLAHVLAGQGLDRLQLELEKARIGLEEDPSDENITRFGELQEAFEAAGGYTAESEVRTLAAGVGLADDRLDLTLGALSGGERRRLELVRILFAGSELLLLDEPTNHLDADSRAWLLQFLRSYRGALVVVSHDLDLLDDAITRVIHVDREAEDAAGTLVEYKGTYSQYLIARGRDEERMSKVAARQRSEIARLSTLANTMRGQTEKRARVAKGLDTRVAKLEASKVDAPQKRRELNLRFPPPPRSARTVLTATGLWKAFGDLDVFSDVSFDVGRGERLLVMGLNGAGKTTLLRALEDASRPTSARSSSGRTSRPATTRRSTRGSTAAAPCSTTCARRPTSPTASCAHCSACSASSGPKAFQDAATLSGGEKTKLALAQLVAGRHNLLLLDEPTNNLDPMSRTATGKALAGWPGTMIVVSHDVEFVRALAPDRVLLMPEGHARLLRARDARSRGTRVGRTPRDLPSAMTRSPS